MTREELLLAKIDSTDGILYIHNETFQGMGRGDKALLALRAVVELCKPNEDDTYKMISSLEILEAIDKELK